MQVTGKGILQTKPHFHVLDGLRGIAALAVVLFHFMEWVYSDYSKNFIGHGFLAVDFFFCLSGFVIGYAYDDRIHKMGPTAFFTSRLIRLQPLVIIGSVLGLLGFLFDPFSDQTILYSTGKTALLFFTSIFLVPFGVMTERSFNLFGLNAPAWSLFWEYVANILYALVLHRISRLYLFILAALAAAGICFVANSAGSLMGGWSKDNFWDGGIRIAYSFLAGLFIYRSNWRIKNRLGFIGLAVLLAAAFLFPYSAWNWLTEPLIVLFYFPLLIALGAGAALTKGFTRICIFLGKISYPLYMTHYAGIWLFANYYTSHKVGSTQLFFIIAAGMLVLPGMAWLIMIFYDIPLRKYLAAKRKQV